MFSGGDLIISEPFLNDPNFFRSVVLVCDHNAVGSFGLVLNQTTEMVLEDVSEAFQGIDFPLFLGGPVEHNTLHYIHTLGTSVEGCLPLKNNLFWSGDLNYILEQIRMGLVEPHHIRFFLGYSGWSAGQLKREYDQGSWLHISIYQDKILEIPAESLWRDILRNQGGKLKEYANYPVDPRLN